MRVQLRYLVPLALFLAIAGVLAIGLTLDSERVPSPLIGKPIPAFDLPQLLDPDERFSDDHLRGQVSLLNVWASWCPPCRLEHDTVTRIAESGVVPVYGLNWKDHRDDALRWLAQFGNSYEAIGYDPDNEAGMDFGVYGPPETFVIDTQGRIRYKHIGPINDRIVREEIMPLIRQLENEAS